MQIRLPAPGDSIGDTASIRVKQTAEQMADIVSNYRPVLIGQVDRPLMLTTRNHAEEVSMANGLSSFKQRRSRVSE
jgi:hypothetical protein